jgi:hypothetical protein
MEKENLLTRFLINEYGDKLYRLPAIIDEHTAK